MSEANLSANAVTPETANATAGQSQEPTPETATTPGETANARLLRESQEYKRKYQEMKAQQEEAVKTKLIEQGNLKEALELERKQSSEWKRNAIKFRIEQAVEGAAAKAGCLNPKALIKLGNLGVLTLDEATLEVSGVESMIDEAKREHGYLFAAVKPPTVNPATPGVGKAPMGYADEIKSAKTQAEFDAIRKKHGRD